MAASAMITRPIPSSGEAMPVIGLGTSQVFDVGEGAAARQPPAEVLRLMLDAGGKIIDTSPMYGRAEAVTGDLVAEAGARPRVFLATKVWTSGHEAGIAQMRRSAELLRSSVIDLIQVHNLLDWRTQLATLRQMKEKGQVRYIGITHYTTGSLPELAGILGAIGVVVVIHRAADHAVVEVDSRQVVADLIEDRGAVHHGGFETEQEIALLGPLV